MGLELLKDLFDNAWVPGDFKAGGVDRTGLQVTLIDSVEHPLFDATYAFLTGYFVIGNDIETRDALVRRFLHNKKLESGTVYHMICVRRAEQIIAARDHTAILTPDHSHIVIHLSHALIAPADRRSGLGAWLRAWPRSAAEVLMDRVGKRLPTTLVAEMSPPHDADSVTRLIAYEKAGFKKVDPIAVPYLQPDFGDPSDIDAAGGPRPPRFDLVIQALGSQGETSICGSGVKALVSSLYRMYNLGFRDQDMRPNWEHLKTYPAGDAAIALLPPSHGAEAAHHA